MAFLFLFVLQFLQLYINYLKAILLLDVCLCPILNAHLISHKSPLSLYNFLAFLELGKCFFQICSSNYGLMQFFASDFLIVFHQLEFHLFLIFFPFSKKFHSLLNMFYTYCLQEVEILCILIKVLNHHLFEHFQFLDFFHILIIFQLQI